jgi:hypothetical protein
MKVKDLQIGEMYFSRSHKLVMKYCGIEHFRGHKYHSFYDASWRLFHWLSPQDVTLPNKACIRRARVCRKNRIIQIKKVCKARAQVTQTANK